MNYRHAYHAGNHTEVFKHSALILLLEHLRLKPQPFMVLDTHSGVGLYDLQSSEAEKTKEAEEGIGQIIGENLVMAKPYISIVQSINGDHLKYYPGSPLIIQTQLRDNDRLIACELHPEDVQLLRSNFRGDQRVAVHHRNGYEAINAFVPPPERRGLVFIDPPFELKDEANTLGQSLVKATRKWPTGTYAAWYPIKDRTTMSPLFGALSRAGTPKCLNVEFLRYREDGVKLAGSGMVFINPPWQIDDKLRVLCEELLSAYEARDGSYSIKWLAP